MRCIRSQICDGRMSDLHDPHACALWEAPVLGFKATATEGLCCAFQDCFPRNPCAKPQKCVRECRLSEVVLGLYRNRKRCSINLESLEIHCPVLSHLMTSKRSGGKSSVLQVL